MSLFATLLATSIFGLNAPDAERQEKLKAFFDPAPNSNIEITVRNQKPNEKLNLKKFRGFISVKPPKGKCFVITRNPTIPSDYICKETPLAFDLTDIDRHGKLTWEVKTGADDTGTVIRWQTTYRTIVAIPRRKDDPPPTAKSKPEDFWQSAPPEYLMIESCNDLSNENSRRIELKLFNGESWRLYFPPKHKLLPQPEEIQNLEIANAGGKRSLSDAAKDKKEEAKKPDAEKKVAEGEGTEEVKKKDELPNNYEDRKFWTISLRNSYVMSSENFHANNTNTSGDRGLCRYNFSGPEEDPQTGRIECQNTTGYHMLLIPTTCISAVKGDINHP
jgi:hypothetical protein